MIWFVPAPAQARTILIVGDSLSAAFGMDTRAGWVALLEQRLAREKLDYTVVNASIGGDISANGLARLPRLLNQHRPAIVIVELGGNDGLRGLSLEQLRYNLGTMVSQARASGAKVLLVGIELPPNYGRRYTERFRDVYRRVAREQNVSLVPFLLDGVATNRKLMQADGIHPTAQAQPRLLDNLWPSLRPLL